MSAVFSPASGDLIWDYRRPVTPTPSSASPIPIEDESSPDIGPESRASRTFEASGVDLRNSVIDGQETMALQAGGMGTERGRSINSIPHVLTSSAEDSPAKTSPLPEQEQGLTAPDPACSSSSHESLTLYSPMGDGSSLRTYPDSFPPTVAEISPSYSRRWASSGFTTSPGECWTADTSECPNGGGAYSSLRDVLEADVHPRFYLSPKAAAGILRRADRRGKDLPTALKRALSALAHTEGEAAPTTSTDTEPMSQAISTKLHNTESNQAGKLYEGYVPSLQHNSPPPALVSPTVRRLTPTECERLQGLPEGWTWVP